MCACVCTGENPIWFKFWEIPFWNSFIDDPQPQYHQYHQYQYHPPSLCWPPSFFLLFRCRRHLCRHRPPPSLPSQVRGEGHTVAALIRTDRYSSAPPPGPTHPPSQPALHLQQLQWKELMEGGWRVGCGSPPSQSHFHLTPSHCPPPPPEYLVNQYAQTEALVSRPAAALPLGITHSFGKREKLPGRWFYSAPPPPKPRNLFFLILFGVFRWFSDCCPTPPILLFLLLLLLLLFLHLLLLFRRLLAEWVAYLRGVSPPETIIINIAEDRNYWNTCMDYGWCINTLIQSKNKPCGFYLLWERHGSIIVCMLMHTCCLTPEEHFAYFQLENCFVLFFQVLLVCLFCFTSLLLWEKWEKKNVPIVTGSGLDWRGERDGLSVADCVQSVTVCLSAIGPHQCWNLNGWWTISAIVPLVDHQRRSPLSGPASQSTRPQLLLIRVLAVSSTSEITYCPLLFTHGTAVLTCPRLILFFHLNI